MDWRGPSNLGFFYYKGIAMEENDGEAARWFAAAAEQSYPRGQFLLGECYEYGYGVEQNAGKALELYQKAVDQGYKRAEESLQRLRGGNSTAAEPDTAVKPEEKPQEKKGLFGFLKGLFGS